MGRIVKELMLGGRKVKALFNTGSERSYICRKVLPETAPCERIRPFTVELGGRKHKVDEVCVIAPTIEEMEFDVKSSSLGQDRRNRWKRDRYFDRSPAMEEWDIKLDPKRRELDLSGLKKREFTEFLANEIYS